MTKTNIGERMALYDDLPPRPKDPLMDVTEVATALGVGRSTVYDAIRSGKLPFRYHAFGRRIRVNRADVEHFVGRSLPEAA